jgi:hypothetical protein
MGAKTVGAGNGAESNGNLSCPLQKVNDLRDNFFQHLITVDETPLPYYNHETKAQSL